MMLNELALLNRYCADKAQMGADTATTTPTRVGAHTSAYAGWAATGDLDLEGERIVGQAWREPSLPLPLLLDVGTGHVGPRVGTIVQAIAEGPALWVTFLVDGEADAALVDAAYAILDDAETPAAMSIYAAIIDSGSRIECDDTACGVVRELRELDLLHVMLTPNPMNTMALVVTRPEPAAKCDAGVPCPACAERAAETHATAASPDSSAGMGEVAAAMLRLASAGRMLGATYDLGAEGAKTTTNQRPAGQKGAA